MGGRRAQRYRRAAAAALIVAAALAAAALGAQNIDVSVPAPTRIRIETRAPRLCGAAGGLGRRRGRVAAARRRLTLAGGHVPGGAGSASGRAATRALPAGGPRRQGDLEPGAPLHIPVAAERTARSCRTTRRVRRRPVRDLGGRHRAAARARPARGLLSERGLVGSAGVRTPRRSRPRSSAPARRTGPANAGSTSAGSTARPDPRAAAGPAARAEGFDGVEADNVDGYANDSGFPLTAADQLRFNRFLARAAHARGLSIGLKNDLGQAAALEPDSTGRWTSSASSTASARCCAVHAAREGGVRRRVRARAGCVLPGRAGGGVHGDAEAAGAACGARGMLVSVCSSPRASDVRAMPAEPRRRRGGVEAGAPDLARRARVRGAARRPSACASSSTRGLATGPTLQSRRPRSRPRP